MPKPENILGQGFHTHPERINKNGRPLKITTILKKSGYSKDDIRSGFEEVGWLTTSEMQDILDNESMPGNLKAACKAYLNAINKGDFRYIAEILAFVYGRPTEQTENKHLHKILVEYVNPNNTALPPASGSTEDTSGEEAV